MWLRILSVHRQTGMSPGTWLSPPTVIMVAVLLRHSHRFSLSQDPLARPNSQSSSQATIFISPEQRHPARLKAVPKRSTDSAASTMLCPHSNHSSVSNADSAHHGPPPAPRTLTTLPVHCHHNTTSSYSWRLGNVSKCSTDTCSLCHSCPWSELPSGFSCSASGQGQIPRTNLTSSKHHVPFRG